MRGPGCREVGHANLASRSVQQVLPEENSVHCKNCFRYFRVQMVLPHGLRMRFCLWPDGCRCKNQSSHFRYIWDLLQMVESCYPY